VTESRPPDPPDDDGSFLRAAGLLLLDPLNLLLPLFINAISNDILKDPKQPEYRHLVSNEDYKKICTLDGLLLALLLWRMSNLPGAEAFRKAGMTPGNLLKAVTSTSTGKAAHALSGYPDVLREWISIESFIIGKRRLVEAFVNFGYADKNEDCPSFRPINATAKLDAPVVEFIEEFLKVLGEAMNGPAKDGGADGKEGE
jgi:hypothetical protein